MRSGSYGYYQQFVHVEVKGESKFSRTLTALTVNVIGVGVRVAGVEVNECEVPAAVKNVGCASSRLEAVCGLWIPFNGCAEMLSW